MQLSFQQVRWSMMITLSVSLLISFFHRFAIGVVAEDLQRELLLNAAMLSNLGAAYFYVYGLLQLPVGFFIDSLGPKRLTFYGMILAAAGSLVFAMAPGYGWALAGRILVTTGVSGIFLSILKIQSIWFEPRYFSLLAGLVSSVGNLGAVLAQAPLAAAAANWGWRSVFLGLCLLSFAAAAAIGIFVHDRPESKGFLALYPYRKASGRNLMDGLRQVLRNGYTWAALFGFAGLMGTNMALGGVWGVSYLSHVHGFGREAAAGLMLWMTIGLLCGSPTVGYIAGRIGRVRPLIVTGSSIALLIYGLLWWAPTMPTWLWSLLFLVLGLSAITFILCFTSTKEANALEYSGIATSVVNFGGFTISAIISLLMGLALDKTWDGTLVGSTPIYSLASYRLAFGVLLVFNVMGWIASFFLYERGRAKPAKTELETD